MSSPQIPSPQLDLMAVAERAASNVSTFSVAPLGVQLAIAQEVAEMRGRRVAELEQAAAAHAAQLAEKDAELAQLRASIAVEQYSSHDDVDDDDGEVVETAATESPQGAPPAGEGTGGAGTPEEGSGDH